MVLRKYSRTLSLSLMCRFLWKAAGTISKLAVILSPSGWGSQAVRCVVGLLCPMVRKPLLYRVRSPCVLGEQESANPVQRMIEAAVVGLTSRPTTVTNKEFIFFVVSFLFRSSLLSSLDQDPVWS